MEAILASICLVSFYYAKTVDTIPPAACFANFRWDDCGKDPEPKMYYWKPGSRCEVGIWRGCLPNINMFKDEYECVSTCVFSVRAGPQDFHKLDSESSEKETTLIVETTETVDNGSLTTGGPGGNGTGPDGNDTGSGDDKAPDGDPGAGGNDTDSGDGATDEPATTAAPVA